MSAINIPVLVPDIKICKGCKHLDIEETSIFASGKVVFKQQTCCNYELCEDVISRCEALMRSKTDAAST